MYAVDDLSDAVDVTREFLTPVRPWMWVKLAVVVFFVGGTGGGFPSFPSGSGTETPTEPAPTPEPTPGTELTEVEILAVALAVVAFFVVVGLVFALIGAIMEFVFVESLRSSEVRVRRYGTRNLGNAFRLFLFRIGLGVLVLLLVGLPVLSLYGSAPEFEAFTLGVVVALGLFALAVFVVVGVVYTLTTNFVVPIMLLDARGVIDGWRRFWPTLRGEWKEYVVYYVLAWILRLAVGIGVTFLILVVGLIVGLPVVFVVFVLFLVPVVGPILGGLLLVVGAILLFLIVLLIQVPVVSYFRYYALLVLGDTNADFDLIVDQRAAVRGGGGDGDRAGGAVGRDDRGDGDGPGLDSTDADRRDDASDEDDWNW